METAKPMADLEEGLEPSKGVKAAELATNYAKPSVASASCSEAESGPIRKDVARALDEQDVEGPPVGRKSTNVGWSQPLVSATKDCDKRESLQSSASARSFGSQAPTLVTRPTTRPPTSTDKPGPNVRDMIPTLTRRNTTSSPISCVPTPFRRVGPKSCKPSIHLIPESHDRGGPGDTSDDSEKSSDDAFSTEVNTGYEARGLPVRRPRTGSNPIAHTDHSRSSNTPRYRRDDRQQMRHMISSDDETWQRRPRYPIYHGYYSHVPLHHPEAVGGPIPYEPPYNHRDESFPYYAPRRPTDGLAVPQHSTQLPYQQSLHPTESQRMHAHTGAQTPPSSNLDLSPASILSRLVLASNSDPIKVVEDYLESLKETKEKELLDAHRILSWINRRTQGELEQKPDAMSFQIHDSESEASYENRPTSAVNSDVSVLEPSRSALSTHRVSFQEQNSLPIVQTHDQLLERMDENSATNSSHTSNDCIPSRPISTIGVQASVQPQDCHSGGGAINEAPTVNVENAITQERNMLRQELDSLKQRMKHNSRGWLAFSISAAFKLWKNQFRKGPPPGTQRLEWTCECGEDMVADLPVANGDEYREMLDFLTKPSPTQRAGSSPSPSDIESGLAQSSPSLPNLSQSGISNGRAPSSTIGSGSTYIGSSSSQIFNPLQSDPFARNKYLELCVNVGKYETKLAEIQITSDSAPGSTICTDAHLFRKIHERYFELRKYTWRRFLYRPAGIKFVHFGVQAGHRVGFFTGDPLPTEEVVASKRYEYNLQPPVPPPIDSRTFLHYFWKHGAHSGSTSARYVDRIPKKLGESLVRSLGTDELREGWGIHIIEGPNKTMICWMLLVILGASFGVSLGYDMIMGVGDSGFAIGQWMVAALTVGLSALWFSLEDEVNTSFD